MMDEPLSALVVMRSAEGTRVPGEAVTAETIGRYLPEPAMVSGVMRFLGQAGFQVSEAVGISFSISAPRSHFESFFGTPLHVANERGIKTVSTEQGLELPLASLPEEIRGYVDAITFTPPPDFGPTEYMGG
jgi:hypothetical protein